MTKFFIVYDNLGQDILNYMDCEDLYNIVCVKYLDNCLQKTKFTDTDISLKYWWESLCQVEIYEQEERNYKEYLDSGEFYNEMKDYINDTGYDI